MSPLKVLGRGYSVVMDGEGRMLRRAADVKTGSEVTALLADGKLRCRVEETVITGETSEHRSNP